ncbi:hypothetical protein quinque_004982 [Culex quinquefasciatus]
MRSVCINKDLVYGNRQPSAGGFRGGRPGGGAGGGGGGFRGGDRPSGGFGGGGFGGGANRGSFGDRQANNGANLRSIKWTSGDLTPFEKNFYKPSEQIMALSETDFNAYLAKLEITLKGRDIPRPCITRALTCLFPFITECSKKWLNSLVVLPGKVTHCWEMKKKLAKLKRSVINPKLVEMTKHGMRGGGRSRYGNNNRYGQNRPPRDNNGYGGQRNDGGNRFGAGGNKFGGGGGGGAGNGYGQQRDQGNRMANGSGPPRPSRFSAAPPSGASSYGGSNGSAGGGYGAKSGGYQNGGGASNGSAAPANGYGSYKPYSSAPPSQSAAPATGAAPSYGAYPRPAPALASYQFASMPPQGGQAFAFPPPPVAMN